MLMEDERGIDLLLERRHQIEVGGELLTLYPPSLGVMLMLRGGMSRLGVDVSKGVDMLLELTVAYARDGLQLCRLLGLLTCAGRAEAMDASLVDRRAELLYRELDGADAVSLLVEMLAESDESAFAAGSGIMSERERLEEVLRLKGTSMVTFGGKTLLGTLVDPVLERYGWTYEEAVWGVSLGVLRLLSWDHVVSVYLSEDERNRMPSSLLGGEVLSGDDRANMSRILSANWS